MLITNREGEGDDRVHTDEDSSDDRDNGMDRSNGFAMLSDLPHSRAVVDDSSR